MMTRTKKLAFYLLASPLMRASGSWYKRLSSPKTGFHRVHLGPGQKNYAESWINVDANRFSAKCDVWANLNGSLPFRNDSIAAFYSHHMVEHLENLPAHFSEAYRCLKPGGVYRVGGPNGDGAIKKFAANELSWFSDFPDSRKSIGGRLDNFLLCRGEHVSILTESYLGELLLGAGFTKWRVVLSKQSHFPDLFGDVLKFESEDDPETPHTLLLEAEK